MRYLPLINLNYLAFFLAETDVYQKYDVNFVYGRCARRMRSRIEVGVLNARTPLDWNLSLKVDKLLSSLIMGPALNGLLVTTLHFSFGKSGTKQLDRTTTNHAHLSRVSAAACLYR